MRPRVAPSRLAGSLLCCSLALACGPSPDASTAPDAQVADASPSSSPKPAAASEAEISEPLDSTGQAPTEAPPEPAPEPVDPLAPLDEATRTVFNAGAADTYLDWDTHYVKSNERRHDVWFPYIEGLGGAYVGVGADQNYTLMAHARSEFAFLIDIDVRVGETHRVYEAFIEASPTPAELLARFEKSAQADNVALLEAYYAEMPDEGRKKIVRAYQASRETLRIHLGRVGKRKQDGVTSSWLSDPDSYAWVRRMFLADRVRVMAGDLTGDQSMKTIAQVATKLSVPVRVLYLSNAEEYFKYFKGSYRQNVRGLPGEAASVVLRTLYGKKFTHADSLWNYQVQPLQDFSERLSDTTLRSRNPMISAADKAGDFERDAGAKGLSLLGKPARRE